MPDHFESSRRKIARAKQHLIDLQREIGKFAQKEPYKRVVEPDSQHPDHQVHKIKLTEPLPVIIGDIAADMVQNLRNALDNAGYSVAAAGGRVNPKFAAFPFAGSIAQMANALGRSKDIPQEIQSLFVGFQPYRGGNDILWALNEMCVADKHKMLIPIGTGIVRAKAALRGTGFFQMPDPHFWDRDKNEMVILILGPGAVFDYDFDFRFYIAFNDIPVVDGQPVLTVLDALGAEVESILIAIEAESRRLGIIP